MGRFHWGCDIVWPKKRLNTPLDYDRAIMADHFPQQMEMELSPHGANRVIADLLESYLDRC